jgi:HSP20 family molecular chaperone IbpA
MSKRQRVTGNVVLCDDNESITTETDQVQSRIRRRAFELSLNRGHAGREVDDWLTAESEVIVSPPVEVAEKAGEFIVRMAAPGIDPKHLIVLATREQVLVKSDFRHDHEPDAQIHSCEFKSTLLFRAIPFPEPIELKSVKTELNDGMLRITARREGIASTAAKPPKPAKKTSAVAKARKAKS